MKTYQLHLLRHGLTQGNLDGVYVGGGWDIPLCQQGADELRDLKLRYEYPGVPLVFTSPMRRAIESADILYPEVKDRIVVEELRESLFGEFEGRMASEMMSDPHFTAWLDPKSGYVPEGGESGEAFAKRTSAGLLMMLRHMAHSGISRAACVTHGGVIMSILSQMGYPRRPAHQWMAGNGCGFLVQADTAMMMRDEVVEVVGILPVGMQAGHGEEALRRYAKPRPFTEGEEQGEKA